MARYLFLDVTLPLMSPSRRIRSRYALQGEIHAHA